MSLYSTTLATQPPPLHPRSSLDVASFDSLTKSLRGHPDLAGESDKILNSFQLAKFVDGVRRFQDDHLGLKNKYRPALRLPEPLLHDRSTSGPLYHAIASAFKVKQSSPWRNFNFDNPKLYDDNVALLKKIDADLINAGLLKRPRVYFDKLVSPEDAKTLGEIAEKFGATVTSDENEISAGKVTHIIAHDPEEHDAPELIESETAEAEKKFLRTLAVFDIPVGEGDDVETKRMALVHWWYFPSSYDEWMDASDVSGDLEKDKIATGPGGAAVVGCKFIRDVERFNEWGCESDYAVMDFERKLDLRSYPNAVSNNNANKKRKKQTAADASASSEPTSKKARRGSTESVTSTVSIPAKEAKSKANPATRQISERRIVKDSDIIGARRIQTGFKGLRGETIRRTVYDGALRVDQDAYKIICDALTEYSGKETLLAGKPEWRKFSPMNALVRPTVDSSLGKSIVITELSESTEEGGGTLATNRQVGILKDLSAHTSEEKALRIRGGGEDEKLANQGASNADGQPEAQNTNAVDAEGGSKDAAESNQTFTGETCQAATETEAINNDPASESGTKSENTVDVNEDQTPNVSVTAEIPPAQDPSGPVPTTNATETAPSAKESESVTKSEDAPKQEEAQLPQSVPSDQKEECLGDDAAKAHPEPLPSDDAVTSETSTTLQADKSTVLCAVKALEPAHQLSSSLYRPPTTSTDAAASIPAFRPTWYDQTKASDFEQRSLPEWFNQSASHRTPASYISIREQILELAQRNSHQYITATALRRSITCDSGSIMRLHSFLTDWSFINSSQVGESAPSELKLRNMRATWNEAGKNAKRKFADVEKSIIWSPSKLQALETFVVGSIVKKSGADGRMVVDIDWDKVCDKFGHGVTVKECQYMFVQPPDGPISLPSTDSSCFQSQETFYSNILNSVRPEVLEEVIRAAFNATEDVAEAKKASLMGIIASVATEKAQEEEEQIRATLMDIVDQRVQRIENKLSMIDDVEALLEAERVSLELERRDMYTTRCRQWFGDGSS